MLAVATGFVYDGENVVQELCGTTPVANLLAGGLDEYFARADSSGTYSFVTDALGSTLALTDSSGAITTQYTFDSFGNTITSLQAESLSKGKLATSEFARCIGQAPNVSIQKSKVVV
jgi:hypothetical protein